MPALPRLLPSLSALRRTPANARLGVAAERDGIAAAWLLPGRGERTRVMACRHFGTEAGPAALSALTGWRRQQRLQRAVTNLLLASDDYQLLPIETLDLPAHELAGAARWKVKDMIDYPAEDAAVACVLVPAAKDASAGASPTRQALAVVAPRHVVAQWMSGARHARCPLTSIDIPELALRNLLHLVPSAAACGLLHVGLARTTLVMVWQGELCTFRRFDLTAQQLASADADTRQALVERLALDLQRTCDAFERQFHTAALGRVWVTDSGLDAASGTTLADALREQVSLDVQHFDLRRHLDIPGDEALCDAARGIDFIPAIGAALRDSLDEGRA